MKNKTLIHEVYQYKVYSLHTMNNIQKYIFTNIFTSQMSSPLRACGSECPMRNKIAALEQ